MANYTHHEMKSIELPIYPQAFISAARLSRERDRVFVAMPFEARHSEILWRVIRGVCDIRGLNVRRADSLAYPNPVVADILDELERAQIIIADLTDLNPNVLYEVGIAHVRCDSVILLCQKDQPLPFDLAYIRCIFFDLNTTEGQIELSERLGRSLDTLKAVGPPIVVESLLERTKLIISDLQALETLPDEELSNEIVWFSGFLSAFAIGTEEPFSPEEQAYRAALLREKDALLSVARRGCLIRGIITPPSKEALIPSRLEVARSRLLCLLHFLESKDLALRNIELVVSPFRQKSIYIIGRISAFEGFKKGIQRGFSLTLRQTGMDAIRGNIALYEVLFDRLATYTISTYSASSSDDRREALLNATTNCLRQSLGYIERFEKIKDSES